MSLFVATVTPFQSPAGPLDREWVPGHLRWLEQQGVNGVVIAGTTGEGPSLTTTERQALIDTALEHRGRLRVFVGTGCAAVPDTIAMTRYAIEQGAEAALVLPPFYFKGLPDSGLLAFYRAVCDALPPAGKILLYHIPQVSHIPIPTSVIDQLLESHPHQVIGIKDSSGDPAQTAMLIKRYPGLQIYAGSAAKFAQALSDGAAGGIFALANVFPRAMDAILAAHRSGNANGAAQEHVAAILAAIQPCPTIPALKALLPSVAGLPFTSVRMPLANLTHHEADELQARLRIVEQ